MARRDPKRAKVQQKSIDEEARLILEILGKIRKSSIISEVITIGGDGKVGTRARKRVAFIRVSLRTNCCSFPRGAHASTSRRQVVHIMVEAPTPFLSTPTRDGKRAAHTRARAGSVSSAFFHGAITLCFRSVRVNARETFSRSYKYRDNGERHTTHGRRDPCCEPRFVSSYMSADSRKAEKNPGGRGRLR